MVDTYIPIYPNSIMYNTIWLFNIAMENPL